MKMDQNEPQFNFAMTAAPGVPLTMSSREIAEVVDSRHDKVKQSIERLVQRGVIVQPPMGDEQDIDAMGRPRTTSVYHVSKRDSYVVVAQLSPEFTARLVDRWQELEERAATRKRCTGTSSKVRIVTISPSCIIAAAPAPATSRTAPHMLIATEN